MKKLFGQFFRFFMVGAFSALVQFSVLTALVELFYFPPILGSSLGYLVGAFMNYTLNHYFAFKSQLPHKKALLRFTLNSFFGFCINFLLMYLLLDYYPYFLSQILTSMVILIWNFTIHRCWTFRA
jgi:putative flippase GtrA